MKPMKLPMLPMWANTVCIEANSSPGPAPYSTPKAAQAGMTAMPAMTAMSVSAPQTMSALRCRCSCLPR